MFSIITSGAGQTERVGQALGALLGPGDLVCLYGDLGAGKTTLACGIAMGLEVEEKYIPSPTFTFVNEYQGRTKLYHIDLYRLTDPSELDGIGFNEYLGSDGVTVIEWAERADEALPDEMLNIYMSSLAEDSREVGFYAEGKRYELLLEQLKRELDQGS